MRRRILTVLPTAFLAIVSFVIAAGALQPNERFVVGERITWRSEAWFFAEGCGLSARDHRRIAAIEPGTVFTLLGDYYEKDAWCWRIEFEGGDPVDVFVDSQSVVRLPRAGR